jgi:uncharacterized protein YegP (UPF0339 family)
MAKRHAWLELYTDSSGQWRWRKVAANGRSTDNPGESFASKSNAKRAATGTHPDLKDYIRDVTPQFK